MQTKKITRVMFAAVAGVLFCGSIATRANPDLEKGFLHPPASARPWVFWFWINGNISKEGITADLEAMKRVGIGGVLWMEVSGMAWAPDGAFEPFVVHYAETFIVPATVGPYPVRPHGPSAAHACATIKAFIRG